MADSAYVPELAVEADAAQPVLRHSLLVRITHWVFTLSFFWLVLSGFAILLAHPHFYWGETGGKGTPVLFNLPLPTKTDGPSGWGRSLHFQAAWLAMIAGVVYVISGVLDGHFRRELLPPAREMSWSSLRRNVADHLRLRHRGPDEPYNVLQRLSYLGVVLVLFPMAVLSGFAMSPAITSVFPWVVEVFGGHQTARTVHFFLAILLLLFLAVHVLMVSMAGFSRRMRAMVLQPGQRVWREWRAWLRRSGSPRAMG
jgi:thiosulfate reductase cytochrome b subunit